MEFEWDFAKNQVNKEKHGVSFEEATAVWTKAYMEVASLAHSKNEDKRSAILGWIGNKIHLVIWTKRNGKIRIISTRRARKNEEKIFFEGIQNDG